MNKFQTSLARYLSRNIVDDLQPTFHGIIVSKTDFLRRRYYPYDRYLMTLSTLVFLMGIYFCWIMSEFPLPIFRHRTDNQRLDMLIVYIFFGSGIPALC